MYKLINVNIKKHSDWLWDKNANKNKLNLVEEKQPDFDESNSYLDVPISKIWVFSMIRPE